MRTGIVQLGKTRLVLGLLLSGAIFGGCAETVPYSLSSPQGTTLIEGTDLWVVWTTPESVQRLDTYESDESDSSEYWPAPDQFVAVQSMPQEIYSVTPRHPFEAGATEATVWIKALIRSDGTVGIAQVAKSSGMNRGFERAALEAAMQSRYSPAMQNGTPVAVWMSYPIEFRIKR